MNSVKLINFKIKNLIRPLCALLSFVCLIWLTIIEEKPNYRAILLLPLTMTIITALFPFKRKIKNFPLLIIYALYVIRYTVFPVILSACDYHSIVDKNLWENYFNSACVLMTVEAIFVFTILYLIGSLKFNKPWTIKKLPNYEKRYKAIGIIAIICSIYLLFFSVLYPGIFTTYFDIPLISVDEQLRFVNLSNYSAQMPSYLFTLYRTAAELFRYTLLIIILFQINSTKLSNNKKLLLMILVVLLGTIIKSFERINSVLVFIVGLIFIFKTQVKRNNVKQITFISMIVIIALPLYLIFVAGINNTDRLCDIANDYFCGPITTAQVIAMKQSAEAPSASFINDFLSSIPIIRKADGIISLTELYQNHFGISGNFVSLCASGYYYFGYLGCWIPAVIIILGVLILYTFSQRAKSGTMSILFLLFSINCAIAIGMYELTIFYNAWFNLYIWCILANIFDGQRSITYVRKNTLSSEI